jgi:hypothetical protein
MLTHSQEIALRGHLPFSKALSSKRLIASDRDGFGSGWRPIQASSFAFSSAGMRSPVSGVIPVRGRPGGLFGFLAIDLPLFLCNKNISRRNAPPPPFGWSLSCPCRGGKEGHAFGTRTRKRPFEEARGDPWPA